MPPALRLTTRQPPTSSVIVPLVKMKIDSLQAIYVRDRGVGVMHDVEMACPAVAELVTVELADYAAEVGSAGQRLPQPRPVDVERFPIGNRHRLNRTQQQGGSVIRVSHVDRSGASLYCS